MSASARRRLEGRRLRRSDNRRAGRLAHRV